MDDAETRRKRLRYQCWHRGTREMDLILGRFADKHLDALSEDELAALERLTNVPDDRLYRWIAGREPVPADYQSPLLARLMDDVGTHAPRR